MKNIRLGATYFGPPSGTCFAAHQLQMFRSVLFVYVLQATRRLQHTTVCITKLACRIALLYMLPGWQPAFSFMSKAWCCRPYCTIVYTNNWCVSNTRIVKYDSTRLIQNSQRHHHTQAYTHRVCVSLQHGFSTTSFKFRTLHLVVSYYRLVVACDTEIWQILLVKTGNFITHSLKGDGVTAAEQQQL